MQSKQSAESLSKYKLYWKTQSQFSTLNDKEREKEEMNMSISTECCRPSGKRPQKFQANTFKGTPIRENTDKLKNIRKELRRHFQTTEEFPYSAIGLIKVILENKDPITGTGTLVGPDLVLTAAHNIIDDTDKSNRIRYSNIEFIPAMNEGMAPFGTCKVVDSFVPEEFLKTGEKEDYALLVLDRQVGIETGYFGIHATDYISLKTLQTKKQEVFVLGYPGYVLNANNERIMLTTKGNHQLWGTCSDEWIIEKDPKKESYFIHYDILTSPGQSGSGVYYKSTDAFYILGIHVLGSEELNTASWITFERFKKIESFAGSRLKRVNLTNNIESFFQNMTLERQSKRMRKEFNDGFLKDPIPGICFDRCIGNQLFGRFKGPEQTPFEGGVFKFVAEITTNYPCEPPKIRLLTKIYHPNIDNDGFICLDILQDQWSPILALPQIILSIISLLSSPNAEEPLVPEIGRLYLTDRQKYEAIAKEWTMKYAVPKQ